MAGKPDKVCLSFIIPTLPPSSNSLYNVLFSQRRVELKPEARLWKSNAKEIIPAWKIKDDRMVEIWLSMYSPKWLTIDKRIRKVDVLNREKLIVDAICEKQGWDDSQLWDSHRHKVVSEKEYVSVKLELL